MVEEASDTDDVPCQEVLMSRAPHFCQNGRVKTLVDMLLKNELNATDKETQGRLVLLQEAQNSFDLDIHCRRYPQIQTSIQFEPNFMTVESYMDTYFVKLLDEQQ